MLRLFRRRKRSESPARNFNHNSVLSRAEFRSVLDQERERASRNQHTVSLVLVEAERLKGDSENMMRVIHSISARIRQVDEIGWFDQGRIGVILPYTTREGAFRLTHDLLTQLGSQAPPLQFEVFSFLSDKFYKDHEGKLYPPETPG